MNKEHRTLASIERAIKQPGGPDVGQMLTPRQTEVIRLPARGYSAKQVARKLGISKDTVWDERSQICKKTNTNAFDTNQNISQNIEPPMKLPNGEFQPPKNNVAVTAATTNMFAYSAKKNIANFIPLYSVW